jgi:hypothetical protein
MLKDFGYKHQDHGLEALYQQDRSREYFAVFNSQASAYEFSQLGQQAVKDFSVAFSDVSSERIQLRVHWLPIYISNDYVVRVFSHLGHVVRVVSESVSVDGHRVYTGLRCVTIDIDERSKNNIPHRIDTSDGFKMLVTCRGRMPLCLRCNHLGHKRMDCPAGRERKDAGPVTYAQAAARVITVDPVGVSAEDPEQADEVQTKEPVLNVNSQTKEPGADSELMSVPDSGQEDNSVSDGFLVKCPLPEYYTRTQPQHDSESASIPCAQVPPKKKLKSSFAESDREESECESVDSECLVIDPSGGVPFGGVPMDDT